VYGQPVSGCEHVVESCFIAEKVRENVLCYIAQGVLHLPWHVNAIVDIAQVFRTAPRTQHGAKDRLSHADFNRMLSII